MIDATGCQNPDFGGEQNVPGQGPGRGVYTPKCQITFLSKGVQGYAIAVRGEINLLTYVGWPPTNSFSHPSTSQVFCQLLQYAMFFLSHPWSSTNLIFLANIISPYSLSHLWPILWLNILLG